MGGNAPIFFSAKHSGNKFASKLGIREVPSFRQPFSYALSLSDRSFSTLRNCRVRVPNYVPIFPLFWSPTNCDLDRREWKSQFSNRETYAGQDFRFAIRFLPGCTHVVGNPTLIHRSQGRNLHVINISRRNPSRRRRNTSDPSFRNQSIVRKNIPIREKESVDRKISQKIKE